MMAWRGRREEEKTAWHAMPGEEGPGGHDAMTDWGKPTPRELGINSVYHALIGIFLSPPLRN